MFRFVCLAPCFLVISADAAEWPQWRGPQGQGHAPTAKNLPNQWKVGPAGKEISGGENIQWLKFTTGIVLLTSGLDEAVETLFADISALELGAHHGVMVLGFVNVLSSLPDMLDGLTGTFLSDDEEEAEHAEDDSEDLPHQQESRPPTPAENKIKKAA